MAETVSTNQFKNGMHVELDGQVWRIVEFQHVKPGKGGAFVRTKLKNLDSGSVVDRTFRAGEKMPRVRTETKSVQYLYDAGDEVVFMDTGNYEQISLPHAELEGQLPYMQPSSEVMLLLVNGRPSAVDLPLLPTHSPSKLRRASTDRDSAPLRWMRPSELQTRQPPQRHERQSQ